jgi:peroxiredoxin/uncharacterized membrane protein YphA (DoxX/SURF4 family)
VRFADHAGRWPAVGCTPRSGSEKTKTKNLPKKENTMAVCGLDRPPAGRHRASQHHQKGDSAPVLFPHLVQAHPSMRICCGAGYWNWEREAPGDGGIIVRRSCKPITGADLLRIAELTLLASRLLLAAIFLLAGATKLVDPVGSRKALRDFGLPSILARPLVVLLPALELAVAAALIPIGIAWYGACGALALLSAFLVATAIAMLRGRRPDCHCFGQLHSAPVGWPTLIRNSALAACAGWVIWKGRLHAGPDLWAWLASLDGHERKVAIVAGCAAGFGFFYVLDRARPRSESVELQAAPALDERALDEAVLEERPAPLRRKPPMPAQTRRPAPARVHTKGIGLPIGSAAPDFELPGLNGEKRSLQSLRDGGKDVLLVFSSPFCDSCVALVSNLVGWTREMEGLPGVVLISRGTAQDNLAKLRGFEPSQVLLQRELEVSEAYDCTTTPTAVVVGADGLIRSTPAVGGPAIKELLASLASLKATPLQSNTL